MLQSYISVKFEVYIVIDFILIRKNYAFIRGLYLLQFTIMFIMNEFMKFPRGLYSFIYLFIYLSIYYLFIIS